MSKKRPPPSKGNTPLVETAERVRWTSQNPSAPSEKEMNANLPEHCTSQPDGIETGLDLPPSYSSLTEQLNSLVPVEDNQHLDITKRPGPMIIDSGSGASSHHSAYSDVPVPPGLECVALNDRLIVRPVIDSFQVVPGCQYAILNSSEEVIYTAKEDIDPNISKSAGSLRFIQILDSNGVVLRVNRQKGKVLRPPKQSLVVWTSQGLAGKVELERVAPEQQYRVLDASDNPIFSIKGTFNKDGAPGVSSLFGIFDMPGVRMGTITLQPPAIYTGMNYSFGIVFPKACVVKLKATLLGLIFLLDYMYRQTVPTSNKKK